MYPANYCKHAVFRFKFTKETNVFFFSPNFIQCHHEENYHGLLFVKVSCLVWQLQLVSILLLLPIVQMKTRCNFFEQIIICGFLPRATWKQVHKTLQCKITFLVYIGIAPCEWTFNVIFLFWKIRSYFQKKWKVFVCAKHICTRRKLLLKNCNIAELEFSIIQKSN